jgi:Arc/MetJ-type ribon-helix-helix transcriptional regulator
MDLAVAHRKRLVYTHRGCGIIVWSVRMAGESERINIVLPRDLAEELRALVPARKRSEVIAQALAEKLARLRQVKALREAAGAWSDEEHPELNDYAGYETWKQTIRGGLESRRIRLGLDAGGEDVSSR